MIRISPTIRISMGLVLITMTVLLLSSTIGLIPDQYTMTMEARESTAKSLAAQCTLFAGNRDVAAIRKTMDAITELNSDILSMGMRSADGHYLTQTGDHQNHWIAPEGENSTSTHWQVPIHQGERRWATLEISFSEDNSFTVMGYHVNPFILLPVFFALMSFIGYLMFMKKALRHLDPTTVLPKRVKLALDTLAEGVIIMDKDERIVLANVAFAEKLGCSAKNLMGLKASKIAWTDPKAQQVSKVLPWTKAISQGEIQRHIPLQLISKGDSERYFNVNVSPVLDDKNRSRGALVTFDDVTELEKKNTKLMETIELLQQSRYRIQLQNEELEVLATHDSLTNCLNRRDFFERAKKQFISAFQGKYKIASIMADIDKFKSINDQYGHAFGDKVIQYVASVLQSSVREEEIVCRYGGEEFCILLPNCDSKNAAAIANRIRRKISTESHEGILDAPGISITVSFGISDITLGSTTLDDMIAQADRALYRAKQKGRNRVIAWDMDKENEFMQKNDGGKQTAPLHVRTEPGKSES